MGFLYPPNRMKNICGNSKEEDHNMWSENVKQMYAVYGGLTSLKIVDSLSIFVIIKNY